MSKEERNGESGISKENGEGLEEKTEACENLRCGIDKLNLQILALLNQRLELALQIKAIKLQQGLSLYDAAREKNMLEKLHRANPGPLSKAGIERVFLPIFRLSLEGTPEESILKDKSDSTRV